HTTPRWKIDVKPAFPRTVRAGAVGPVPGDDAAAAPGRMAVRRDEPTRGVTRHPIGPRRHWPSAPRAVARGRWLRSYPYDRAATILAGTSEVQRDLVAQRVLGLPRG
ncbi:MAG TPA: hypothetical protein VL049_12050, partial [Candidatus Dormibacteraeota bacterium]|nr:hypothetical protein [Candidatus Dormibacteraeota bacterium]